MTDAKKETCATCCHSEESVYKTSRANHPTGWFFCSFKERWRLTAYCDIGKWEPRRGYPENGKDIG